jgi:hypothetical protein
MATTPGTIPERGVNLSHIGAIESGDSAVATSVACPRVQRLGARCFTQDASLHRQVRVILLGERTPTLSSSNRVTTETAQSRTLRISARDDRY